MVDTGRNDMDSELRNLRSKLGIGENDYDRNAQTVLNALASKLKARIEKVEQPVQSQLSITIREVGKALQDADVVQRGKLDGLKSNLREIQLILRCTPSITPRGRGFSGPAIIQTVKIGRFFFKTI